MVGCLRVGVLGGDGWVTFWESWKDVEMFIYVVGRRLIYIHGYTL